MISTPDKATARDQLLTQLGEEASTKLRLATVRLTAGLFTGSGVILTTVIKGDRGVFVVATAAHNLWFYVDSLTGGTSRDFWGGDKGKWSAEVLSSKKQAIIDLCLARLNVEYASADMTQPNPTAAVTTATIGRVILAEFQYDLCLLLIPFPLRARPRCEIVASSSQLKEAKELMLELIKHGTLPVGWELLQAGYGRTRADNPDSAGNLNFKLSKFSNGRPATYYDTTAGENTSVLVLESSAAWTTLPGDSGGPLFAVNRVKGNTHVIGVTLGSDVFATLQAEQQGLAANDTDGAHNNAATALDRVYDGWDELGSMVGLPLVRDHFSL